MTRLKMILAKAASLILVFFGNQEQEKRMTYARAYSASWLKVFQLLWAKRNLELHAEKRGATDISFPNQARDPFRGASRNIDARVADKMDYDSKG